ncbi:heavy-metal-associated domain-containing protein [Streptomyces sp. NPDC058818]|uniref:heavy-metal-associated domain-containing protein n=1 Tax=Streptomyces sp. NPDC058818 TaxID=3346640 RepID=UPI0036B28FA0
MASPATPNGDAAASGTGETSEAGGVTVTYVVEGMVCGHCATSVTEAITGLDGVRDVNVDVQSGQVSVSSERELEETALARALDDIGYEMSGRA